MKSAKEYLDEIKIRHSLTSDYQLASYLGISQAAVSRYRSNKNYFDDYTSLLIAKALDINPMEVIADSNYSRAKKPQEKKAWREVAKRLGTTVAAVMLFFLSFQYPTPVLANSFYESVIYIMRITVQTVV